MREGREVVHHKELQLTRVSEIAASSQDREEHFAMARNVFLSKVDQMSPATVTTREKEVECTVRHAFGGRREQCSVLSVSFEIERRTVRELIASPAMNGNEYNVPV